MVLQGNHNKENKTFKSSLPVRAIIGCARYENCEAERRFCV